MATELEKMRTFTENELEFLCRHYKCKVNIWQWNPVDEMRCKLQKDGRFKNRSERYCRRLITKGVNLFWPRIKYDEDEILKNRQQEFVFRRRRQIWKLRETFDESIGSLMEIGRCIEVSSANVSIQPPENTQNNLVQYAENLITANSQNNNYLHGNLKQKSASGIVDIMYNETPHSNVVLQNSKTNCASINRSIHLLENNRKSNVNSQRSNINISNGELNSEGNLNSYLCNALNISTETLSCIDIESSSSELQTTSINLNSQEIANMNYDDFNKKMTITSTQSQFESPPKE